MSGFRFGFLPDDAAAAAQQQGEGEEGSEGAAEECWELKPAIEVARSRSSPPLRLSECDSVAVGPGVAVLKGRVGSADAAALMHDARLETSDLVPSVYEGGFRL